MMLLLDGTVQIRYSVHGEEDLSLYPSDVGFTNLFSEFLRY
jgi:hypothetical protein